MNTIIHSEARRLAKWLLPIGLILLSSGCGSSAPTIKASDLAGARDASDAEYEIGPGDSLQIFVWDHQDLSTTVAVRPDGKISTPLVEDLQAAGKTPTALASAEHLTDLGVRPVFLTRGYGGRIRGPHTVDPDRDTADDVGDEPLLLARTAPTVVAVDRAAGARHATALGAGAIVMDDGFQNPGLFKDLSVLVVDGKAGTGNGRVLPAGPLRAPLPFQLDRADALVVVGDGDAAGTVAAAMSERGRPVLRAAIRSCGETSWLEHGTWIAFAGIANPDKFFAMLEAHGADLAARRAFPDHHRFTEEDALALLRMREAKGASLVTTEKDRVRLRADRPVLSDLRSASHTLPIRLEFEQPHAYAALLETAIRRSSTTARQGSGTTAP